VVERSEASVNGRAAIVTGARKRGDEKAASRAPMERLVRTVIEPADPDVKVKTDQIVTLD